MQDEINVQEGKFLKNIKRAGHNRRAGRKIFLKLINVQTKIRPGRGEFFLVFIKKYAKSLLEITELNVTETAFSSVHSKVAKTLK